MKVKEAMTTDVATVQPGTSLKDAARTLVERRISGLPVVDAAARLVGMLSEGDILFRERGEVEGIGGPLAWLISPSRLEEFQKIEARLVGEPGTPDACHRDPRLAPQTPLCGRG